MRVHMTVGSRMPRNLGSSRVYCVQITQNPGTRLFYTQPNLTLDLVDCFRMCRKNILAPYVVSNVGRLSSWPL